MIILIECISCVHENQLFMDMNDCLHTLSFQLKSNKNYALIRYYTFIFRPMMREKCEYNTNQT